MPYWVKMILAAILAVARSAAAGPPSESSINRLAEAIGQSNALADLAGRYQIQRQATFQPIRLKDITIPEIPFREAVRQLLRREPQFAETVDQVHEIYQRNGFALARAASAEIAEKVQNVIAEAMLTGAPRPSVVKTIAEIGPWSEAYANTVYRTNTQQAIVAGRFQQVSDPRVQALIPAFEFLTLRDVDVRRGRKKDGGENHKALHGLIAAVDSVIWHTWAPPGGFNCRCQLRPVGIAELRQLGLIDSQGRVREPADPSLKGAAFHPGFGGRPDLRIYAA